MEYRVECDLEDFSAWQGGRDTLDILIDRGDCDEIQQLIEDTFLDELPTETEINDFLWFECDFIAQHLGYDDWDAYENGEEEDDDEEGEYNDDANGTPIFVNDKVYWNDEAGIDEDGERIAFTVVDLDGTGYFNLSYGPEDTNPDRWAWHEELEVLE